jgi:hypothetical protein
MLGSVTSSQAASLALSSGDGMSDGVDQLRHEQDFQAQLQQNAAIEPMERLDAQPASTNEGMTSTMMHRLDAIDRSFHVDPTAKTQEAQLGKLEPGDPAAAAQPDPVKNGPMGPAAFKELLDQAFDRLRSTAAFSIEAQILTNGATTCTRTANQLMKGN